jgi:hypothetical protein
MINYVSLDMLPTENRRPGVAANTDFQIGTGHVTLDAWLYWAESDFFSNRRLVLTPCRPPMPEHQSKEC